MKAAIHPDYHAVHVHCACGATWETKTTQKGEELRLEICSNCHPFFTGKQRLIDSEGRVERFTRKFGTKITGTKSPVLKTPPKPAIKAVGPRKEATPATPKKEKKAKEAPAKDAAAAPDSEA